MAVLNRSHFQKVALGRLRDARTLYAKRRYSGAFYIAGYAVECALKACIAKRIAAKTFPPKPNEVRDGYYTHDFRTLIKTADLRTELDAEESANPTFKAYWAIVTGWNEQTRYETDIPQADARDLLQALEDPTDGVMRWLQLHW